MTIMTAHTNATLRKEKSHIDASLKRRARLLVTNNSIPSQTRSLIRYALEIKDPYLAQLVCRVEAGEVTIDHVHLE
jgi:REP element-mobilizing transposase RayT